MTEKFAEPLHFRSDKRDDEVRRAGMVTAGQQPAPPRYWPHNASTQTALDGRRLVGSMRFKPDKPCGKSVAMPNDGPAHAWPGKYPSEQP